MHLSGSYHRTTHQSQNSSSRECFNRSFLLSNKMTSHNPVWRPDGGGGGPPRDNSRLILSLLPHPADSMNQDWFHWSVVLERWTPHKARGFSALCWHWWQGSWSASHWEHSRTQHHNTGAHWPRAQYTGSVMYACKLGKDRRNCKGPIE